MKNSIILPIATLILCFGFQVSLNAQKIATWKGGTPGRTTDWECATNWKEGRVPNEFSSVVIPDVSTTTFVYPVISKGIVEIASLECAPVAKLTLKHNAQIVIYDTILDRNATSTDSLAISSSVDSGVILRD